ncbi:MAG: bifunctional riboflavin kinase/FAD synthetase [Deltaproteobacteria bacterium]|nr:MAG: bifunctional riboflavin kinase/FAD synthetase [Deltaproteobacteria bacterium]
MTTTYTLDNLPEDIKNPVVTIGNFDGVHWAHQAILKKVIERAKHLNGTSVVITFEPHPIKVMSPKKARPLITLLEQKRELVTNQGINIILLIRFTREFAAIAAREFVKDILVDKLGIKEVVVGYDYAFGRRREGNIKLLKELGQQFNFKVHQVGPVYVGKSLVSSTSIRNLIMDGNVSEAKRLLGRNYQIRGEVIRGRDRGGPLLGYPTANLRLVDELIPKEGVYLVTVDLDGKIHQGLTNIGYNPTFKDKTLSVETHILDLSADIVKKKIKINFLYRLRDEITFASAKELSQQISRDIKQAREFFSKSKNRL